MAAARERRDIAAPANGRPALVAAPGGIALMFCLLRIAHPPDPGAAPPAPRLLALHWHYAPDRGLYLALSSPASWWR